jgi:hypothetical protein
MREKQERQLALLVFGSRATDGQHEARRKPQIAPGAETA